MATRGADGSHPRRVPRRRPLHFVPNVVMTVLTRIGVVPHSYVLTTVGRKTGLTRRNPVTIVEREGHRWLVAPYGVMPWVQNARAAGRVSLSRRWRTDEFGLREASAEEAGPVLKEYLRIAPVTRPYFVARPQDPPEAFAREAGAHPVFELVPAGS